MPDDDDDTPTATTPALPAKASAAKTARRRTNARKIREYLEEADIGRMIRGLRDIAVNPTAQDADRIRAATALLDRIFGRPREEGFDPIPLVDPALASHATPADAARAAIARVLDGSIDPSAAADVLRIARDADDIFSNEDLARRLVRIEAKLDIVENPGNDTRATTLRLLDEADETLDATIARTNPKGELLATIERDQAAIEELRSALDDPDADVQQVWTRAFDLHRTSLSLLQNRLNPPKEP